MSIFIQPISEITFENVIEFCEERVRENEILDYKGDFPSKLERTIAAMANMYGGVIIIGVQDDDGYPKPPIEGIQFVDGLSERVTQICIDTIYPPVLPEVKVVRKADKAFVIIRVHESDETPHSINNRTKVCIRTNDVTKLERATNEDEREWLINRRNKAITLKQRLWDSANRHLQRHVAKKKTKNIPPFQGIFICPTYPSKVLANPFVLDKMADDFKVNDVDGRVSQRTYTVTKPIVDGIFHTHQIGEDKQDPIYFEINQMGSVYFYESIDILPICEVPKPPYQLFFGGRLLTRLDHLIDVSSQLYCACGYWGLVDIEINFEILHPDTRLTMNGEDAFSDSAYMDNTFTYSRRYLVRELMEKRIPILEDFLVYLFWSFGNHPPRSQGKNVTDYLWWLR